MVLSSCHEMRTIMARSPHETSFSLSRRHFRWILGGKAAGIADDGSSNNQEQDGGEDSFRHPSFASEDAAGAAPPPLHRKGAVARLRSALVAAVLRRRRPLVFGPRLTGTLFGNRRGHVHLAFQVDPRACPALLLELTAPTAALVREMASGLVRIALECDRPAAAGDGGARRLVEEPFWRAYCNGKKCGYAVRRECGSADWKVLRAVEPVSMGAGVLPADAATAAAGEGDVMYMRARFERVVGSKDSEAFYMMNPDGNGGPELSIYLLRV